jgi:hypothetical protein
VAEARLTGIDNLIALEVCRDPGCTCREGLPGEPDFSRLTPEANGHVGSILTIYSESSGRIGNRVPVTGVPSQSVVKEAFEACDGPVEVSPGELICGAIARLRKQI